MQTQRVCAGRLGRRWLRAAAGAAQVWELGGKRSLHRHTGGLVSDAVPSSNGLADSMHLSCSPLWHHVLAALIVALSGFQACTGLPGRLRVLQLLANPRPWAGRWRQGWRPVAEQVRAATRGSRVGEGSAYLIHRLHLHAASSRLSCAAVVLLSAWRACYAAASLGFKSNHQN